MPSHPWTVSQRTTSLNSYGIAILVHGLLCSRRIIIIHWYHFANLVKGHLAFFNILKNRFNGS